MTDHGDSTSPTRLVFAADDVGNLTHRLFRYPAKFHPPVARALVERFSKPGDVILDPFCGSGTVMVEAAIRNRRSIGTDVDPLAIAITRAKATMIDVAALSATVKDLLESLRPWERSETDYVSLALTDINLDQQARELDGLWVPKIPRLEHWFRRYVVVDLARILREIQQLDCDSAVRHFLLVVFASIIRNASNADPVPVSGLEVTSHMKRLDEAGRIVNPYQQLRRAIGRAKVAMDEFVSARPSPSHDPDVFEADAAELHVGARVDAVITSPPYQNAVDYYRRHQLEMFWLGQTESQDDRLALLPRYIGKHRVASSHPMLAHPWSPSPTAQEWLDILDATHAARARDFMAYMTAMSKVFDRWADILDAGSPAVCVVGRSRWNGADIPTERLFVELAAERFALRDHLTYEVRNRYMSYSRKNGASIDHEHVLVFERT